MKQTYRVGILFGGQSAEHEVSLQSARNVFEAIDQEKYEVVLIGIDKTGGWHVHHPENYLLHADDPARIQLHPESAALALVPGNRGVQFLELDTQRALDPIDVIFPILHGPYGEDGTVQGLLKLMDIPFVGAGVLGSAVGMDKYTMKRLLQEAKIPTAKFKAFHRSQSAHISFAELVDELGLPLFVKPANLGSSVGVSRVSSEAECLQAIAEGFRYDQRVLIEECIIGREIECSVLGNAEPIASLPGEIMTNTTKHRFYSYQAKYIDEAGAELGIPAELPESLIARIQALAIQTFKVIGCEGMARVDCFVTEDQRILINEPNTIPGFTRISMYPKLWEASGLAYADLIDRLIQLALERHTQEKALETSFAIT